jgi:hypothetical protein
MKLTLETLYKDHDDLGRILCLLEKLLIDLYRGSSGSHLMLQRSWYIFRIIRQNMLCFPCLRLATAYNERVGV